MRAASLHLVTCVALASTACRSPSPTALRPPPGVAVAARTAPPPSADPPGFGAGATAVDVDGDGLIDRVRPLPSIARPDRPGIALDELPAVLVAHALPGGLFSVDDEVTRAALRGVCPEAPPARLRVPRDDEELEADARSERRVRALALEALCALAWGRSPDAVATSLRAAAAEADVDVAFADAIRSALAPLPFSAALAPLAGPFPPTAGAGSNPAPPRRAPDAETPSREPICAALAASEERMVARALAAMPRAQGNEVEVGTPERSLRDTRRCDASSRGVWSVALSALTMRRGDEALEARAELAYAAFGERTPWRAVALPAPWQQGTFASTTYALVGAFDYDGDGHAEAIVRRDRWEHEGAGSSVLSVFTARDGAARPYAPAARLDGVAIALADPDGDRRVDFVLPGPWRFIDHCGMDGIAHEGPTVLAHSLADGGFSMDDAAARAWLDAECSRLALPEGLDAVPPDDRDVWRVACARARGASPDAIVAALRAEQPERPRLTPPGNDQSVCYPFQTLAALALVRGPFAPLTPSTGAPRP